MLITSITAAGGFCLPLADLLKAIGTGNKISQQPYMVLTGYPPRWHKFDPAAHAGHTGPALKLKTQADAAKELQAEFHDQHPTPLHAMPLEQQHALINAKAEAKQAAMSAAAAVSMFKAAVLAGKKPSPAQLKAFGALPDDKRLATLEALKAAQPKALELIIAALKDSDSAEAKAKATHAEGLIAQQAAEVPPPALDPAPAPAAVPEPPAQQPEPAKPEPAKPTSLAQVIALKGWKKAVAAGKKPTPAQMHAFAALSKDEQMALVNGTPVEQMGHATATADASLAHHAGATKAKAQRQAETKGVTDMDAWAQIGPQAGSNPGGLFQAPDGSKWYCKFPKSIDHAKNEILAAKLYEAAGVLAPQMKLVEQDGKIGVAAAWVDGLKKGSPAELKAAAGALDGFAVDAWLANWDVVGLGHDNLLLKDGKAVRVDTGGALLYRAQGSPKGDSFGTSATELMSLTNPTTNPQAAGVFGGMSQAQLSASIDKVKVISTGTIAKLVDEFGPGSGMEKIALAAKLVKRRDYLAGYQSGLKPEPPAAPAKSPRTVVAAVETGPKEGDTKPGANGATLVLKNGRWVTQTPGPAATPEPVAPAPSVAAVSAAAAAIQAAMLPASNVNAGPANKKLQAIHAALLNHDMAALQAMSFGVNTYNLKAKKLADAAIAALASAGPDPAAAPAVAPPAAAPAAPSKVVSAKEVPAKEKSAKPKLAPNVVVSATEKAAVPSSSWVKLAPGETVIETGKDFGIEWAKVEIPAKGFNPESLPTVPAFTKSSKAWKNAGNAAAAKSIVDAAKAGQTSPEIKAITFPELHPDTGVPTGKVKPITAHPSGQVNEVLTNVLAEVEAQRHATFKVVHNGSIVGGYSRAMAAIAAKVKAVTYEKFQSWAHKAADYLVIDKHAGAILAAPEEGLFKEVGAASSVMAAFKAASDTKVAKLSETFKNALVSYTGSAYHEWNKTMRKGEMTTSGWAGSANLRSAFDQAATELPEGIIMWRGIGVGGDTYAGEVGSILQDGSVQSCSYGDKPAFSSHPTLLRIHIPKGVKAIHATSFSKHAGEREVILDRQVRYAVVKVTQHDNFKASSGASLGKKTVVDLIALPHE